MKYRDWNFVMLWNSAVEQGVDFNGMEPGEITTIKAMARTAGVGSQQVTIEKGPIYRYADYGLGTYLTEPYYISYGSVRATAYCIQPAKPDRDQVFIPSQSWLTIRLLQRYVITVPMRQVQKVILRTSTWIFHQERDLFLSIWRLLMLMAVVMRSMEPMQQTGTSNGYLQLLCKEA